MGVSRRGVGCVGFSGGCNIKFIKSFSKASLYGTVAGEKSTTGWDCGGSAVMCMGLGSSEGVRGALDGGVESCAAMFGERDLVDLDLGLGWNAVL